MSKGKCYYDDDGELYKDNDSTKRLKMIQIQNGKNCVRKIGNISYIILLPFSTTLIETEEVIGLDNYIGGTCHSKVGIIANGIGDTGTMFGPNYCGHFLISLHNVTDKPLKIKVGKTIVSIVFHYLKTPIDKPNSTDNGHLEKMASLGVKLKTDETEELNKDWKRNLEEIRKKMIESKEYLKFKKDIKKYKISKIKRFFNKRNILIMLISISILIGSYILCGFIDMKNKNTLWTDRFWNVGCSGIVIYLIQSVVGLLREKK